MATSGQQEVLELFGKHLPSVAAQATTQEEKRLEDSRPRKWPKPEGKGGRPASRATRSNRGWSNNWSHWDGNDQAKLTDQVSGEDVRNLLALVTRLSLRQEDDLAATRADNAFLFYLETRTTGIYRPNPVIRGQLLRHSPAVAEDPRRDAGARVPLPPDNPAPGLHDRVPREASPRRGAGQQGSFPEGRLAPGGRDELPCWTYSKWDPERKEAIIDTSRTPITHAQVLDSVARLVKLLSNSSLVHKFRATRPLAETYDSNILTFLMTVATRGQEADQLFATMLLLTDCNATRLMCTRVAKERQRRQPLAQVLSQEAQTLLRADPAWRPSTQQQQEQEKMED